uniref:Uncharacterized protein n=1 Tax=Arundo donax TaxID=35708 RepID=A0A0A9B1U7_ARUDO
MITWARGGVSEGDVMFVSCLLEMGGERSSICNASILFYVVLRSSVAHEHSLKCWLEIVV